MISNAFPNGLKQKEYFSLLLILYDHMSDRNLAEVVSAFTDKEYAVVLNDVWKAVSEKNLSDEEINLVKQKLKLVGFDEWVNEE